MKKYILSAIAVMAFFLTSAASPVERPDCGCGGKDAKTVNTPDSLLTPAEIKVKQFILSDPLFSKGKVSFTVNALTGGSAIHRCESNSSNLPPASLLNWSSYMRGYMNAHPNMFWCVCQDLPSAFQSNDGSGEWLICITIQYRYVETTQCDCIDYGN